MRTFGAIMLVFGMIVWNIRFGVLIWLLIAASYIFS